jgi:hypothetical protein
MKAGNENTMNMHARRKTESDETYPSQTTAILLPYQNQEEMQKKVEAIMHMGQTRKQGQTALDMKSARNARQDT